MSKDEHFKFVKALAIELNRKEIKLASFPDVVLRVRNALDDPDTTGENLADILSVDPVLASRILILANSTYHNPAGIKIEGLAAAVGRIGFEKVRTAALSYAVELLHSAKELEALKSELRKTWSDGLRLAAMSEVIAKHCTKLDADSAFMAGLLHRIGVLYIFGKYDEYPGLLKDPESRQNIIDEWAGPIGESIVGHWDFSDDIKDSVNPDEVETTKRRVKPNLADIVTAAKTSLLDDQPQVADTEEAQRLNLTDEKMPAILESYQKKIESLATAVR